MEINMVLRTKKGVSYEALDLGRIFYLYNSPEWQN
jgi:hypothetical protein